MNKTLKTLLKSLPDAPFKKMLAEEIDRMSVYATGLEITNEVYRVALIDRTVELKALKDGNLCEADFREMREMLRAMQAGELTVSRGIEILETWADGNWNDKMLPPVRQDLIKEDSMPVEIIDRLRAERDTLLSALDVAVKLNSFRELNDHIPAMKSAIASVKGEA